MGGHRIEVTIVMQQAMAMLDAERRNDEVDGLADRNAATAQHSIIRGCFHCEGLVKHCLDWKSPKSALEPQCMSAVPRAAQNFEQHKIPNNDLVLVNDLIQLTNGARIGATNLSDPDRAIDNDHLM